MPRPLAYVLKIMLTNVQKDQIIESLERNIEGNTSMNQAIIKHTITKVKEAWDEQHKEVNGKY